MLSLFLSTFIPQCFCCYVFQLTHFLLVAVAPAPDVKPIDPQARVHAAMFDPLNQQTSQMDSKAVDQFDQIGKLH